MGVGVLFQIAAGASERKSVKGKKYIFLHKSTLEFSFSRGNLSKLQRWLFFCRFYKPEHIFHDKELSAIIGTLIEDPKKERGGNMQASIQPIFTWSQEHIFAGGARNIVLLVEWRGIVKVDQLRKRSHKIAARDIELRIWLEPHLNLTACHGCRAEAGEGRSLLLNLGNILCGQHKYLGLAFELSAMPTGKHDALWVQWLYKQPPSGRIRELPLQKLGLEYSHHTAVAKDKVCFHVEKHLELLKTQGVLDEVASLQEKSQFTKASEHLRRHADQLLLMAARSGDLTLLKQAEALYKQSEGEQRAKGKAIGTGLK
jgi:hypothetical protein